MTGFRRARLFAIGHSTRPRDELVAMLKAHGVNALVDVRTVPRSRTNPQFNRDVLARVLPRHGIFYAHLKALGGLRHPRPDSNNGAWRNASFRGYADHMQTDEFEAGLAELRAIHREHGPAAFMCAEGNRFRCHRSLLADALVARGARVLHIESTKRAREHAMTPFARVYRGRVTYPPT